MLPNNPNNSWASGASRPAAVPRSTSVEYESQAQAALNNRRPTSNRLPVPNRTTGRKPPSKSGSLRHVPDSEGEEDTSLQNGREKSPFEQIVDVAKRALAPVTYYAKPRSQGPQDTSMEDSVNGKESSYDYAAEEREFQAQQQQQQQAKRTTAAPHKRGRISTDNKAYKPSASDAEESDEDFEEDGKTKRRKKKKGGPTGGPLNTLPVLTQDKRKKRKSRGSKGNLLTEGGDEEDMEEESDSQMADTVGTADAQNGP